MSCIQHDKQSLGAVECQNSDFIISEYMINQITRKVLHCKDIICNVQYVHMVKTLFLNISVCQYHNW